MCNEPSHNEQISFRLDLLSLDETLEICTSSDVDIMSRPLSSQNDGQPVDDCLSDGHNVLLNHVITASCFHESRWLIIKGLYKSPPPLICQHNDEKITPKARINGLL